MALTGFIQQHLQAAGSATPVELFQRIALDPEGAIILSAAKATPKSIRAILSSNDVAQNEQGWCQTVSRRPLRYTSANRTPAASTGDLSLASLTSLGVNFLNRQQISTFVLQGTDGNIDSNKRLPGILGIRLPDLRRTVRGLDLPPHSVVASVVATEITGENLHETFCDAWCRTSCAHEQYLIVGRINMDPEDMGELRRLSDLFGVGVVGIVRKDGFDIPVTIYPATRKPDEQILRELMHSPGAVPVFLVAALASIHGESYSSVTNNPATNLAKHRETRP
jgi:hypothetical protein